MMGFHSLEQIVATLRARWRMLGAVAGGIFLLIVAVTALMPRTYKADATLVFNLRNADAIVDKGDGGWTFNNYIASEMELIRSRRVAERLAGDAAFQRQPAVAKAHAEMAGGRRMERWLASYISANVTVSAAKNSRAVTISAEAADPELAAAIANGVADAYLATNVDLRVSPAQRNSSFFTAQKKARHEELVAAQARFDAFLRETGMTGLEQKSDVDDLQLRSLSEALTQAQADRARASAEGNLPGAGSAVSAGLIDNSVVQRLRGDIADQQAALKDMSVLRGPNNPMVVQAEARLRELEGQLAAETSKIAQGLQRNAAAVSAREAQLQALERRQRAELTMSAANRSKLAVLTSDVERAKAAYDAVGQRLDDVELAGAAEMPTASILSASVPPAFPASPSWPLNLLLGLFAGLLGGVLAALGGELIKPIVRTRADLEFALGGVPVLAELRG